MKNNKTEKRLKAKKKKKWETPFVIVEDCDTLSKDAFTVASMRRCLPEQIYA
ncbi:MAG: hypothetical protein WC321_01380 [Candidatus Omnitrophota bacterium]|jgi:hypothetical protein